MEEVRTRFISPHSFRHSSRFPRLTHFLSVSHVTRYLVPTRRETEVNEVRRDRGVSDKEILMLS